MEVTDHYSGYGQETEMHKIQQGFISQRQHLLSGKSQWMTTTDKYCMVSSSLVLV